MTIVPSLSRGTNSEPSVRPRSVVRDGDRARRQRASTIGNRRPSRSSGRNSQWARRSTSVSLSDVFRGSPSDASTGISVSDRTIEPARAKMTVRAIGRNSFPSTPFKRQDRQVDDHDDQFAEHRRLADLDGRVADDLELACGPVRSWARCRTQFSTMTTELSTTRPKSIAPRLIRLPAMPTRSIIVTANSIDSGMADGDDQPGPEVAEEGEQDGDDQDRPFEQVPLDGVRAPGRPGRCARRRPSTSTPGGRAFLTSSIALSQAPS